MTPQCDHPVDLGVPSTTRTTGWEVRTDSSGTVVTVESASTDGSIPELSETFIFHSENGTFRLYGYDSNLP